MRKLILFFLVLSSVSVFAQTPRAEIFGGYSFLHEPGANFNGWNGAATINVHRLVGITADFSGHYWSTSFTLPLFGAVHTESHVYTYVFGPTVSMRNSTRFSPFVRLLAGGSHITGKNSVGSASGTGSTDNFAIVGGGGLDVSLSPRFAIRPVQLDYHGIHFSGGWMNNLRYSAGVVLRFGER